MGTRVSPCLPRALLHQRVDFGEVVARLHHGFARGVQRVESRALPVRRRLEPRGDLQLVAVQLRRDALPQLPQPRQVLRPGAYTRALLSST